MFIIHLFKFPGRRALFPSTFEMASERRAALQAMGSVCSIRCHGEPGLGAQIDFESNCYHVGYSPWH
jgi:hypothetical protein